MVAKAGAYRKLGSVENRFFSKVHMTSECWMWKDKLNHGYGVFRLPTGSAPGLQVKAHRYAYEQMVGPIPDGMTIDHLCLNKACVRPDHLEPVSPEENARRGHQVPRRPYQTISGWKKFTDHCRRGHLYTKENTIVNTGGNRECRECKNARRRVGNR